MDAYGAKTAPPVNRNDGVTQCRPHDPIRTRPEVPKTPVQEAEDWIAQGRANLVAPADYTNGSALDRIVKAIISKAMADGTLSALRSRAA
jgi:hypothetical protein